MSAKATEAGRERAWKEVGNALAEILAEYFWRADDPGQSATSRAGRPVAGCGVAGAIWRGKIVGPRITRGQQFCSVQSAMPPKATLTMESSRQKRESMQTGLSTPQEGRGEPLGSPALRLQNGFGCGG
jgi:hypothetical protein